MSLSYIKQPRPCIGINGFDNRYWSDARHPPSTPPGQEALEFPLSPDRKILIITFVQLALHSPYPAASVEDPLDSYMLPTVLLTLRHGVHFIVTPPPTGH